ncbi:hypothetical protein ACFVFH_13025 [Streptomyces sp. NPDC057697]
MRKCRAGSKPFTFYGYHLDFYGCHLDPHPTFLVHGHLAGQMW